MFDNLLMKLLEKIAQEMGGKAASFVARFEHIDGYEYNASLFRKVCVVPSSVRAHCQL